MSDVEELFVYFIVSVNMGTSQIITLANGLFHFNAVKNSQGYIVDEHGLNFRVHPFYEPVHPIEHLHLVTPLGGNSWILVEKVEDIGGPQKCHFRVNLFHLLLPYPLSAKSPTVRVGISTSS